MEEIISNMAKAGTLGGGLSGDQLAILNENYNDLRAKLEGLMGGQEGTRTGY